MITDNLRSKRVILKFSLIAQNSMSQMFCKKKVKLVSSRYSSDVPMNLNLDHSNTMCAATG